MAIQGYLGGIFIKSGPAVPFSDVSMTDSGDQMEYIISDNQKRYWDKLAPVTVERSADGETWEVVQASEYTIEHIGGRVVFNSPQTDQIRVSGSYFPMEPVSAGFEWELSLEQNAEDTPTFGGDWNQITPTTKTATGSFSWYWSDGSMFEKIGDDNVIIVLYVNELSNIRYEFSAVITSDSIEVPTDGVVTEELEFSVVGPVYFRTN